MTKQQIKRRQWSTFFFKCYFIKRRVLLQNSQWGSPTGKTFLGKRVPAEDLPPSQRYWRLPVGVRYNNTMKPFNGAFTPQLSKDFARLGGECQQISHNHLVWVTYTPPFWQQTELLGQHYKQLLSGAVLPKTSTEHEGNSMEKKTKLIHLGMLQRKTEVAILSLIQWDQSWCWYRLLQWSAHLHGPVSAEGTEGSRLSSMLFWDKCSSIERMADSETLTCSLHFLICWIV